MYLCDQNMPPRLLADISRPPVFSYDGGNMLPPVAHAAYRWLLLGGVRSGSNFHTDPFAMHAWNACLSGTKVWALYPPSHVPPGVKISSVSLSLGGRDAGGKRLPGNRSPETVTNYHGPSAWEWFTGVLPHLSKREEGGTPRPEYPLVVVQRAGDVVFTPSGWWHCVLNLEPDTLGFSEDVVSKSNVGKVLRALQASCPESELYTALRRHIRELHD